MTTEGNSQRNPISAEAHRLGLDLFNKLSSGGSDQPTQSAILGGMIGAISEIVWRGFAARDVEAASDILSKAIAEYLTQYALWDRSHSGGLN